MIRRPPRSPLFPSTSLFRSLAAAIVTAAKQENLALLPVAHVSERPGEGLLGIIEGQKVQITGRGKVASEQLPLPPLAEGLECLVFIDGRYAAALDRKSTRLN